MPQKKVNPDELLKQIVKMSGGRHKIYLGMAPGAGKTYRMLEDALELKKKGIDIIIGYIEGQNRGDNQNLIKLFDVIPRRAYKVNDKEFYDLDLEAILERKPATVIVDELAHHNISGSVNQKRYEDVQELLKNGISVLSTLNIYHLESISPIIEKNLGIKVNETVPDWVLNQADEVLLIDITVDELYKRLETKEIYNQEHLKHALKNFFKKSNLYFLRDLALNFVAERVDLEVTTEKVKAKIKDRILVAASPKESSLKLIKHAGDIASIFHADLDILCFCKTQREQNEKTINRLREATKEFRGNFFLFTDPKKNITQELIRFIKHNRTTQVVMGYPNKLQWTDFLFGSNLINLLKGTSNIDIIISGKDSKTRNLENINQIGLKNQQQNKQGNLNWGKLKICLGMAPGVGKTYKMLADAKALYEQGANILLGVIDTHGRSDTANLMQGLPTLPLKIIEHKGKHISEFDLEAAILAKPEYILVDELAHTNAPGSINNKRYQDVQYLLRAGINVMSTVNIQHIESLNDIVEQVTGIKVRETVPDWIISNASELVIIDLSPEALQERLKAGKIYSVDKIEQALTHFFQKKNLIALRELSLREVAESVEHEMYTKEVKLKILSFVEINEETLRLIRKSARIANRLQAELIVMHIIKDTKNITEEKKLAIIELEQLVVELGGDFRLAEGNDIVKEIISAESKIKPDYIVFGEPKKLGNLSIIKEVAIKSILSKLENANVWVVGDFTREV